MELEKLGPCPRCGDYTKPCRCALLKGVDRLNLVNRELAEALEAALNELETMQYARYEDLERKIRAALDKAKEEK